MTDIERQILTNQESIISALYVIAHNMYLKPSFNQADIMKVMTSNLDENGEKTLELLDKYK